MRCRIYLIFLLLSGVLYAQQKSKVVLEERDGIVYVVGNDIPYTGVGVIYINDKIDEKIHYVEGIRHGMTTKYGSDMYMGDKEPRSGILIYEVNYVKGLKEGMEYFYSIMGDIYKRVNYTNGLKAGGEYTPNGYVAYKNGIKEGPEVVLGSYNRVVLYVNYVNGKEKGIKYYTDVREGGMVPTMFIKHVLPYKDGSLNGTGKRTGANYGQETIVYNFKNGRKQGKEECIDTSDFTLKRKEHNYVNGKLEGVGTYYEYEEVLAEVPYVNGKAHGIRKDYDQEGKVVREVYYSNGECVANRKDIKDDVYVGKIIDVDSLEIRNDIVYELNSSEPYTGKGEEYDDKGEFRKERFYVNGIVEQENEYYQGMFYGKRYYKKGVLHKDYYTQNTTYPKTDFTKFIEMEVRKKIEEPKSVVRMYVGAESGNGEKNSEADDKYFGVKFVNGRREGIWKFDRNGKGVPSKQGIYVNNRLEGDVIGEDGKTVIEQYKNGMLHGEKPGFENINEKMGVTTYVDGYITGMRSHYRKSNKGFILEETNYKYSLPYGESRWYDEQGVLKGSSTYEYGIMQGISREYHSNGMVKTEVNFVDDEEQGEKKTYSPTGELLNTVYYNRGKLEGYLVTYHENMVKQMECNYANGLEEGEKKVYDTQGVLKEKGMYKKGFLHGEQTIYWPNTTIIKEIGTYKNGRRHGETKEYNKQGVLEKGVFYVRGKLEGVYNNYISHDGRYENVNYKNGVKDGEEVWYYSNGKLGGVSCYIDGKREELTFSYHPNGKLYYLGQYKNGKQEGEFLDYYTDGQLRGKFNYKNGYIDGIVIIYGRNGLIESEVPYKNGERLGEAKYYHDNGMLKSKIRYIGAKQVGKEYHYNEKGEEIKSVYKL